MATANPIWSSPTVVAIPLVCFWATATAPSRPTADLRHRTPNFSRGGRSEWRTAYLTWPWPNFPSASVTCFWATVTAPSRLRGIHHRNRSALRRGGRSQWRRQARHRRGQRQHDECLSSTPATATSPGPLHHRHRRPLRAVDQPRQPGGQETNASTVNFTVTFSEAVTGVVPGDFQVALTGTATETVSQVTPVSGAVYTVTVNGISGDGTLQLNLVDNSSIRDLAGNPLTRPNSPAAFQQAPVATVGQQPNPVALRWRRQWRRQARPGRRQCGSNTRERAAGQRQRHLPGASTLTPPVRMPRSVAVGGRQRRRQARPGRRQCDVGNTVSVLLGNGNGTFQAPDTFATGA